MSIDNFDQLNTQQEAQLDERVEAIARFVSETGRNPQDWFVYQSLNASEMDDMTAITVDMNSQYPNLSQEEIQTLVSSKYKLDSNLHTEEEIKLSQLQLKMDAEAARKSISELRDGYSAPQLSESQEPESFVTEEWVNDMVDELDDLEAVEFDLGNGQVFNFGLEDATKVSWRRGIVALKTSLILMYDRMESGTTTSLICTWLCLTTLSLLWLQCTSRVCPTDSGALWIKLQT